MLTNDGAALLERRLQVRRRAAAIGCAVGVLAVMAVVVSIGSSANSAALVWYVVGLLLVSVAVLTWAVLVRLGERQLAATLSRRVSRDTAMSVWRQLGVLRSLNCVLVGTACVVSLGALIAAHASVALIAMFAASFVVMATLSVVALWELVHAPALAVDEGSLAADQRLRRQNVYDAVYPLLVLVTSVPTQIGLTDGFHNSTLETVAKFVPLVSLIPVIVIEQAARWIEERDRSRSLPSWRSRPTT